MRLLVSCLTALCLLNPSQSQAAWDIFQSYVILDSGGGDQYLAGGINADGASTFDGTDLGDFTAADALTLNGGELKTYKNGSSNVCGGNLNYRVYASGDTPGAFSAVNLTYDSELGGGDQKWSATGAGIDLLGALPAGDYVLELYWDASGDDAGGCSDTKFDSNFGNNFTATFSIIVLGCTDPAYTEYDPAATTDDGSCTTLVVEGCTDPAYTEYDASANTDDGSCATLVVEGCTDPAYTEYDASANTDDGSCATPVNPCAGALELGSIDATATTDINTADGSATLTVTTGTPTSLTLTGLNGAADYTIAQPGPIDGLAPGSYTVTATDANGCTSNTLTLIMTYGLCCDCGVSDTDSDGLCDDADNCTDKTAMNYADPANGACTY